MEERKKDLQHIKNYTVISLLQYCRGPKEEDELDMKRHRHTSDVTETTIKEKLF